MRNMSCGRRKGKMPRCVAYMKKKPRFFCDNCGYEVSSDEKSCQNCGRFFSAVRCPSCNYSGPDEMFKGGCPMCGYSAPPSKSKNTPVKKPSYSGKKQAHLPAWTYIVSIIVVLAIIAIISFFITK